MKLNLYSIGDKLSIPTNPTNAINSVNPQKLMGVIVGKARTTVGDTLKKLPRNYRLL